MSTTSEDDLHQAARKLRDNEEHISHLKYDLDKQEREMERLQKEYKDAEHTVSETKAELHDANQEHERLSRKHDEKEREHRDEMNKLKKAA